MTILVIDAQGGGLGRALIEKLRSERLPAEILAVGTNASAADAMRRAGADAAACGENAVVYNAARADIIVGGIGIIGANSMMGEVSPAMAAAVSGSEALKVLIPLNRCNFRVAGVADLPLPAKIDAAVAEIKRQMQDLS